MVARLCLLGRSSLCLARESLGAPLGVCFFFNFSLQVAFVMGVVLLYASWCMFVGDIVCVQLVVLPCWCYVAVFCVLGAHVSE